MGYKSNRMKQITFIFLFFTSVFGFSQSHYSTVSNRVLISGIVNGDTVIIENIKNKVTLNGQLGILEVHYSNLDARVLGKFKDDLSPERAEIPIDFTGEYSWLDAKLKTTEIETHFTDDINVILNNEDQLIPVDVLITRVRGAHGFMVFLQMKGKFSPKALKEDFPNLKFTDDLLFSITLNIQVTN
tara:strand:- start:111660 stop:112217 length:558 start_codon:yes stop_codon:yes gene_type:complete